MMRGRILKISLGIFCVLLVLMVSAYFFMLKTERGQKLILDFALPFAEDALNSKLEIASASGSWPEHIVLTGVTARDDQGEWLSVERLELKWSPIASLFSGITVELASLTNTTLERLPDFGSADEDQEKAEPEPRQSLIPSIDLPRLAISTVELTGVTLGESLIGTRTTMTVEGSATHKDGLVDLDLDARAQGAVTDAVKARIFWEKRERRMETDVAINAPAGGLLGAILEDATGHEGALSLTIKGSGAASDWRGTLNGQWDGAAVLNADMTCSCLNPPDGRIDLSLALEQTAPQAWRDALGEKATLALRAAQHPDRTVMLSVESLDFRHGRIVEPLTFTLHSPRFGRQRLRVSGAYDLGPTPSVEVPDWIGSRADLSGDVRLGTNGTMSQGRVEMTAGPLSVLLDDLKRSESGMFSAESRISLRATDAMPDELKILLGESGEFTAEVEAGETISLQNAVLETGGGAKITLGGTFNGWNETLDASLKGRVSKSLVRGFVPDLTIPDDIKFEAGASGTLEDLSARLTLDSPKGVLDQTTVPGIGARLDLTRASGDLEGTLSVQLNGPLMLPNPVGNLSARFRMGEKDGFTLRTARISYAGIEGMANAKINGELIEAKGNLSVETLSVLGPDFRGSLKAEADIQNAKGGPQLVAQLTSPSLSALETGAERLSVSAKGKLTAPTVNLAAKRIDLSPDEFLRDVETAVSLETGEGKTAVRITALTAQWNGEVFTLESPLRIEQAEGETRIDKLVMTIGQKGRLEATAAITPDRITGRANFARLPLPGAPMRARGSVSIDTDEAQPARLRLALTQIEREDARISLEMNGDWNGELVHVDGKLAVQPDKEIKKINRWDLFTLDVPLKLEKGADGLSFKPGETLSGRIDFDGRLDRIASLFAPPDLEAEGRLRINATLEGPVAEPSINAQIMLSDAAIEQTKVGLRLTGITGTVRANGTPDTLEGTVEIRASTNDKPEDAPKAVTIDAKLASNADGMDISGDVRLRNARLVRRKDIDMTVSGRLSYEQKPDGGANASGTVTIDKLDFIIPSNEGSAKVVDVNVVPVSKDDPETEETVKKPKKPRVINPVLDIKIRSDGQAFVRGRGLESEWKTNLGIGGDAENPTLKGNVSVITGTLDFAGRQFKISRGTINFTGGPPTAAALDIAADYETDDGTKTTIRVTGTVENPKIALESSPSLPQEAIMSLILFGKPATELTALEALQVTQALASLGGISPLGGGPGIMDKFRRTLGLDVLRFDMGSEGDNSTVGLTVGKYVRKGVFVSATQDTAGQSGSVSVRVDVTKSISIKTDVAQDAEGSVAVQWRKDY